MRIKFIHSLFQYFMHKLRKNNHHCGVYTFRAFQNITRKIITNNGLLSLTDNNRYYCCKKKKKDNQKEYNKLL